MNPAEQPLLKLLREGLEKGGFETDDVLAIVLPLFRQTLSLHEQGFVAPLDGIGQVEVTERNHLAFAGHHQWPPKRNLAEVEAKQQAESTLAVLGEVSRTTEAESGDQTVQDRLIARSGEAITKPVYLPDYRCWEQMLHHHDELTDVFSLGLILASFACGLDLSNPDDLEIFAHNRENLFAVNPRLNPVVASVIVQMTELNRHRRVQDLASVIGRLESYREQPLDLDLQHLPGFEQASLSGRRKLIQGHLRERLFDLSRRNRLIYFKGSAQTLNLTVASVPLVLDWRNIRLEQLFVWHEALAKEISSGSAMQLAKYLRFEDAPYIPGVLDKMISEARRDRAEFGVSQLRLVLCFLRWHNLKENPQERIHSPLLLLPVEITKKRGVRDSYVMTPLTTEAEVNPALRQYLKQLYNLDLPERIDLKETTLDQFHASLQAQIHATEPAVTLQKVDRPQIQLIHERARQRLDQFERRQKLKERRVAASGPKEDYSYAPENLKPLGLQLFLRHVKPSPAPLRDAIGAAPAPRALNVVPSAPSGNGNLREAGQQMYALRQGEKDITGNPYAWEFDLCSLTLGNFNYRKMTLMRDYTRLAEGDCASDGFDRIFSLDPRPPEEGAIAALPLAEQHLVIACDATQASAIARARMQQSYIIQGPPGTGKSQTITNLIADYVAQGKRVLFVCEKRAAIDVVFYRLRQQQLDELCCLIHDSQTDKRAFIQNLKQTCEQWLAQGGNADAAEKAREKVLREMEKELAALGQFSEMLTAPVELAGLPLRSLLGRLVELRDHAREISAREEEQIPHYHLWREHGETAERLHRSLDELGEEPRFSKHPFRWLSPKVVEAEHPLENLLERLDRAEALLDEVSEACTLSGLPEEHWDTVQEMEALLVFMLRLEPLRKHGILELLDEGSPLSEELRRMTAEQQARAETLRAARDKTVHWKERLPPGETASALEQARKVQGSVFALFNPAWWRLRKVLNARYDFSSHAVRPQWTVVLEELNAEWAALEEFEKITAQARERFGVEDLTVFTEQLTLIHAPSENAPKAVAALKAILISSPEAAAIVERLAGLQPQFGALVAELTELLIDFQGQGLATLGEAVRDIRESSESFPELLPVLSDLASLPEEFARALRQLDLAGAEFEAASGHRTLHEVFRRERGLQRFDSLALKRRVESLQKLYREWLECNAAVIRARVRARFLEHAAIAAMPISQLEGEQKIFKKNYAAGRKELEHEFGKSMRYKSIRELAGGNTGEVVRDLKPIWLMSPLSVSDTLPLDPGLFDVVIFDEASQIPVEEAVPALYRAPQVIVVGDEMQLPPTSFFTAHRAPEDDELVIEEEGDRIEVALDADSFLTQSARNLPSTLLAWHYRSRYEALISFSNAAFYGGNLFTIPDRLLPAPDLAEINVTEAGQGKDNVPSLLARSISFHLLANGVYENRRNTGEAAYIAELVRELLTRETKLSVGIVAFSEAQQTEIESALQTLAGEDPDFGAALEAEFNREENDQFCGLFVKNLENVQGDERDIIILSICYGPDANGRMVMNFGPINQRGGEKRLNVIFSRARHHMAVVSSIRHLAITNDYNDGARALKNFLQYAESVSKGTLPIARQVLENLNPLNRKALQPERGPEPVIEQLAAALRERGYAVDLNVGQSRFRCDLGVRHEHDRAYRLAILVDSEAHYANPDLLERYLLQPSVLRASGWEVMIVLAKDWLADSRLVLDRIDRLFRNIPELEAAEPASLAEETLSRETPPARRGAPAQKAAPANQPSGVVRRFEFIGGASRKFWQVELAGPNFTVTFGRIGTEGQSQTKQYADEARARRESEKLIAEKLRKGYQEVNTPRTP